METDNMNPGAEIYSTWCEIDLDVLSQNVRYLKKRSGTGMMAVVKANGYGHGLVPAARAARLGGADWLGVARLEEAVWLREEGITGPILVLGYTAPQRASEAAHYDVSLTVYDRSLAAQLNRQAAGLKQKIKVHAKLDTGMGRLGELVENSQDLLRAIAGSENLELEGLFTHFARADEPERPETAEQIQRFSAAVRRAEQEGLRPRWVHACNSAGTLYFPEAAFDMVRCGIAIYGLHPSNLAPLPPEVRPVLSWKTRLVSVKTLPPGSGIGYNHRYVTRAAERIGVIPVGYADGFRRRLGNFALVAGKRVNVAGGVCMDQCMLQLDPIPQAQIGDEVVLIGAQAGEQITAEEVGEAWGTINYEVTCGLAARVPRFYRGQAAGGMLIG